MGSNKNKTAVRIQEKRKELKLTRQDIATYIKKDVGDIISLQAVDKWLSGKNRPKPLYMASLAKLFHVSIDYLNGVSDIDAPSLEVEKIMIALGLSKESIQNLYNAQSNSVLNHKMTQGSSIIAGRKDIFLLRVINMLLETEDGKKIATALYDLLTADFAKDNRRLDTFENAKIMYMENGKLSIAEEEHFLQEKQLAIELKQAEYEVFLLNRIYSFRTKNDKGDSNSG